MITAMSHLEIDDVAQDDQRVHSAPLEQLEPVHTCAAHAELQWHPRIAMQPTGSRDIFGLECAVGADGGGPDEEHRAHQEHDEGGPEHAQEADARHGAARLDCNASEKQALKRGTSKSKTGNDRSTGSCSLNWMSKLRMARPEKKPETNESGMAVEATVPTTTNCWKMTSTCTALARLESDSTTMPTAISR
jgi:hypothetical protein